MPLKLVLLHRYYLWAYRMRAHLVELGRAPVKTEELRQWSVRTTMYTGMWLSHLQVVVEGWEKLKLTDATVDALLAAPYKPKLRTLRNALFHFDIKNEGLDILALPGIDQVTIEWAAALHDAIGDWFMAMAEPVAIH